MSACNIEVIKFLGKYFNTPVGTVCYNTDRVPTAVLDNQNVEGFASIALKLAAKANLSKEQFLLSYQWLEHTAMYADQAASNHNFAKQFLKDINKALEINSYLTGQLLTVADIAAYYVLYPILTSDAAELPGHLPLPKQILPHELKEVKLDKPVVYHPQPFAYPGYPVVLYL